MYQSVLGKNSKSLLRDGDTRQSLKTGYQCLDSRLVCGGVDFFFKILLHRILLLNQMPQS